MLTKSIKLNLGDIRDTGFDLFFILIKGQNRSQVSNDLVVDTRNLYINFSRGAKMYMQRTLIK